MYYRSPAARHDFLRYGEGPEAVEQPASAMAKPERPAVQAEVIQRALPPGPGAVERPGNLACRGLAGSSSVCAVVGRRRLRKLVRSPCDFSREEGMSIAAP
jgi:hypothetical protein